MNHEIVFFKIVKLKYLPIPLLCLLLCKYCYDNNIATYTHAYIHVCVYLFEFVHCSNVSKRPCMKGWSSYGPGMKRWSSYRSGVVKTRKTMKKVFEVNFLASFND